MVSHAKARSLARIRTDTRLASRSVDPIQRRAALRNPGAGKKEQPLVVSSVLGQIAALTEIEKAQLMACEDIIATGWSTFVQVGLAMATIRNNDLYRETFKCFEDYCREKWQYGRAYVN